MSEAPIRDDVARWRHFALWAAGVAAVWALVLLAAATLWAGDIGLRFALLGWASWSITFILLGVNHALRFARWHWMLRSEGHAVPAGRSLAVFLAGLALLPTPGKAGVAVRSFLLQRDGVPVNVSLAVHFSERLFDLLGLVVLAALLVGQAGGALRWPAAAAAAILAVLGVWSAPWICRALTARVRRESSVHRALRWLQQFADHAAKLVSGWRFWPYFLLGAAANIATGVLLWRLLAGSSVGFADATGIVALSHLTGSLSLLPGGIGGFEVAMFSQLSLLGVTIGQAMIAIGLVRVATLWGSVAIGLPILAWQLRTRIREPAVGAGTLRPEPPSSRASAE